MAPNDPDRSDRSDRPDTAPDAPGARRRRRRAKLKAEIFEAAMTLFAEKGYDHVTVDEIAAAAEIAKGTFFNYFPTKEHVLVEYRHALLDDAHAYGASLDGDSARELVKAFHRRLARNVCAEGSRYDMVLREVVARPHLIAHDREYQGRYRPYFERFIAIGKRSGEIPADCDPGLLMETLRDLWTGTSITWMLEAPDEPLETLVDRKIDFVFDLLDTRARK